MRSAAIAGCLLIAATTGAVIAQTAATNPTSTAAAAPVPSYLLASQADMLLLLSPPPAVDSPAQRDDLQAVLAAQRAAHANGTLEHAIADAELNCNRIADALGDAQIFTREPQVLTFLNKAARESSALSGQAKNYWQRTRPFAYSSEVERHADMAAQSPARAVDVGSAPGMAPARVDLAHSSYPSGHSTYGTVCAILLADMVPEKRAQLYARALDFAHSRMVVGAHFPTDLEAGRLTGTVAAQLLMQNAAFQHDFDAARVSLRAGLGLAAEPPVMEPPAVH